MSRILVLANHFVTLYNFRQEILDSLYKAGHEIILSIPDDKNDFFSKCGYTVVKVNVDRRGINPVKDAKLCINYFKLIKKIKPDVVLAYTIKPNLYGGFCCKILKTPSVLNVTGLGSGFNNSILKWLLKFMYKVSFNKSADVFVQNAEILKRLSELKIKPKSMELIPGSGVNLERYECLQYPENNETDFFFISRVMKEKGIDEYITAAKYFKKKGVKANFHIFGWCEEAYEEMLGDLTADKTIIYHGMCDNMLAEQKYNSCTVHPSYHEGMSNVLLESSACGRPCICSNISGCKEIVEDGVTGFLAEPQDSESLIVAFEKFLSLNMEARREMGVKARQKVEKEFDRNIVVNKYMNKITEITKGE